MLKLHHIILLFALVPSCTKPATSSTTRQPTDENLGIDEKMLVEIQSAARTEYGSIGDAVLNPGKDKVLLFVAHKSKNITPPGKHFVVYNSKQEKVYENNIAGHAEWYDDDHLKISESQGIIDKEGNSSTDYLIHVDTGQRKQLASKKQF